MEGLKMDITEKIWKNYEMIPVDLGKWKQVKAGMVSFEMEAYDVKDVGRVSFLRGKAMMGLMKMETVMITTKEHDSPLFSYDRILAMGKDTMIIEMFQTMEHPHSYPELSDLKKKYSDLKPFQPKENWYDSLLMDECVFFKDKEHKKLDDFYSEYLSNFLESIKKDPILDSCKKLSLHRKYVDGLLEHGGPSTDVFVKAVGKEKTKELFRKFLFGVE